MQRRTSTILNIKTQSSKSVKDISLNTYMNITTNKKLISPFPTVIDKKYCLKFRAQNDIF